MRAERLRMGLMPLSQRTPSPLPPCEDAVKKKKNLDARFIASMNIPGPYQAPNWCCLVLGLPEIGPCWFISHPVYGILL